MATCTYIVVVLLFLCSELCGLSEVDPSADWWSLGAILFEMLTGKVCVQCRTSTFTCMCIIIIVGSF